MSKWDGVKQIGDTGMDPVSFSGYFEFDTAKWTRDQLLGKRAVYKDAEGQELVGEITEVGVTDWLTITCGILFDDGTTAEIEIHP